METLISAVEGEQPPGLYRLTQDINIEWLSSQAKEHGWKLFQIEGKAIKNKADFLQACAREINFPSYFGYNWDAFEECIRDLDRASINRFILLYEYPEEFAQHDASEWLTAFDILQEAVDYWRATDTPMYVLFKTNSSLLNELEVL
jgi:RNAse (barnase) inhibitor barstar